MTGMLPHGIYGGLSQIYGLGQQGLQNSVTSTAQQIAMQQAQYQNQLAIHASQMQSAYSQMAPPLPMAFTPSTSLPRWLRPDPSQPDTLGWRSWLWHDGHSFLMSPHQTTTAWPDAELTAIKWSDEDALRGVAGIHARLVPKHWKIVGWPDDASSSGLDENKNLVTGIVERFGRYVLGTEGWRAEQVIIRELVAPSTEIGLKLEQRYPNAVIHYVDQIEGEDPCKSEKSSALEKGSRSLSPSPQLINPNPLSPPSKSPEKSLLDRFLNQRRAH